MDVGDTADETSAPRSNRLHHGQEAAARVAGYDLAVVNY